MFQVFTKSTIFSTFKYPLSAVRLPPKVMYIEIQPNIPSLIRDPHPVLYTCLHSLPSLSIPKTIRAYCPCFASLYLGFTILIHGHILGVRFSNKTQHFNHLDLESLCLLPLKSRSPDRIWIFALPRISLISVCT